MKLVIALLTCLTFGVVIGCGEEAAVDLGDPYAAVHLVQAREENASRFDLEWKGNRINVAGVVDRVDDGKVYLVAGDFMDSVALDGLSQEEQAKWNPGDEVEYACDVGDYVFGTISMNDCGPAQHGEAVAESAVGASTSDTSASTNPILGYWSLPALLIASVLTVTAMARSTWKRWQPPMIAVMCLGVLAILNVAATVVFGYTTVNTDVLTPLAAVSFLAICVLGWIILNPEQFPSINGVSAGATVTGAPIVPAQPDATPANPPDMTNISSSEETAVAGPSNPVAAAVPTPSQTMAMQPSVASSMAWLVVTRGPSEGKSVQLKEGNNNIGRSLENDLQIDDASVSRSHAMVNVKDDQFTLVDLGSTGGSRIGEHRISGKQLGSGSTIIVGQTTLSLVSVDAFQGGPSSGATIVGSPSGSSLSLVARSGPDAGKSFLLASAQNLIGRDSSAQVVLSDPTVSRRHAMLRVDAERTSISDLGSQSGTQVDGEIITGVQISVGDRVVVGQSEFTLMKPGV